MTPALDNAAANMFHIVIQANVADWYEDRIDFETCSRRARLIWDLIAATGQSESVLALVRAGMPSEVRP